MPWIIAVMIFLTVLAAGCALALGHGLERLRGDLAGGYTIQIIEADAAKRAQMVRQIEGVFHVERAVRAYRIVLETRLREQLAPWLGEDAAADGLPIPALIDLTLAPGTASAKIAEISRAVKQRAPSARIDAHQSYLAPVEALMRALIGAAAGLVMLMLLATGAVVVLAARGVHDAHRGTIDIMHMLGATDLQIARLFQRRIALDALLGAAAGTVCAIALLWLIGRTLGASGLELAGLVALPWRASLWLLALPLFAMLVATATARITVMRALERSL